MADGKKTTLMRKLGIQSVIRKKRRYFDKSGSTVFPNLLGRNFKVQLPNKKLATDITYLPTTSGFIYLSVVQDLYTNEVVAYALSSRNELEGIRDSAVTLDVESYDNGGWQSVQNRDLRLSKNNPDGLENT